MAGTGAGRRARHGCPDGRPGRAASRLSGVATTERGDELSSTRQWRRELYDSDHARSLGEVGREGVAIDSLADMETLFAGIPLGEVSTSMTVNSPAAILLAYYLCVGEQQGVPRAELRGTIQTDILKEYIAQKEYIFPPEPSMRLVTDMVEFCAREMPKWHPISISGYHIREAGSTAAQELAFTLADGFTYVEWAVARGLHIHQFAPRPSFFFNAHLDFFPE